MKLIVVGAGMQAKAICHVLAQQADVESVGIADISMDRARMLAKSMGDSRFWAAHCDASTFGHVKTLLKSADAAIGAASYKINYVCSVAAIESNCHYCDLGGNNDVVAKQLDLHNNALLHRVAIIPDCGLAPGLVSILTAHAYKHVEDLEAVEIRCGGLPQERDGVLDYALVFSIEGLINEYAEDALVLRNWSTATISSLEDVEEIEFPAPFGKLEAFTTSGGISTLPSTYVGKIPNLDYKTIRYPGHGHIFRVFKQLGMFDGEPRATLESQLRRHLRKNAPDVILLRVTARSKSSNRVYEVIDYPNDGLSAMERMTGFPAALVLLSLGRGEIGPGARPQEVCVDPDKILRGLDMLGVSIVIR
jgi:lysine 6-dehydrogenase